MHQLLQRHTIVDNYPGEVAILREGLVKICDGNHCAAMMLDYFYEKSLIIKEVSDERIYSHGNDSTYEICSCIHATFEELKKMMSGLFDFDIILNALDLLATKGHIEVELTNNDNSDEIMPSTEINIDTNIKSIENALLILRGIEPKVEPLPLEPMVQELIEAPAPKPYIGDRRESKRVDYHLNRARVLALPATLTLEEWITTLNYFNWQCAYCSEKEYQVFEHFVPLFHGGGTTAHNCVPACYRCNTIKMDAHPSVFEDRFAEDVMGRVKSYLASLHEVSHGKE